MRYSAKPWTRKYVKGYRFLSFERNLCDKYGEKLTSTATKQVFHETAKATGESIRNNTADKIVKPKPKSDAKSSDVDEVVLSTEIRQEIVSDLRQR